MNSDARTLRRRPPHTRGQLAVTCVAAFVVWAGFGGILPYLPVFLKEEAQASVSAIGLIAASFYVGTFAFSSPLGTASDRIGRKPLIVSGLGIFAVSTLLFLTTTNPVWFVVFRLLKGVGAAAVTPAAQALVADLSPDDRRSAAYGWLATAQLGGLVAGPAFGAALYSLAGEGRSGFYSIFVFSGVLAACTAAALLVMLRESEHVTDGRSRAEKPPALRRLITRPIGAFLVLAMCTQFAMGLWEVLWGLWLRHLGASVRFIGITWMAFSLPMLLSFAGGRLADRYSRFFLLYSGYSISGIAWLVYGLTRNLHLFLAMNVTEGLAYAWAYPAKQAFLVQVSPPRWVGAVQGLESSAGQLAALVGTLAAPFLYSALSGFTIGLGGVVLFAGLMLTAPVLATEWRRQTAAVSS